MKHLFSILITLFAFANIAFAIIGRRHAGSGEVNLRDVPHAKVHRRNRYDARPAEDNAVQKDCVKSDDQDTTVYVIITSTLEPGQPIPTEEPVPAVTTPAGYMPSGDVPVVQPQPSPGPPGSGGSYGSGPGEAGSGSGEAGQSSSYGSGGPGETNGSGGGLPEQSSSAGGAPEPTESAPEPTGTAPSEPSGTDSGSFPSESPSYPANGFWLANIKHQGVTPFNTNSTSGYSVFRNVKDFGAKGDGKTDDTDAINAAIAKGNRCAQGCDSTTTEPALVYFPAGTYLVSKPIVALYLSQLVGDPTNMPIIKAASNFDGIAVIDSDPYVNGVNFYFNTNNFFRAVRNFVIDLTATPQGTGIHWQVAQATSLINIKFEMGKTNSQGIFMDNGSGGFMSDLTFNGGKLGMFLGNQQFTTRNLVFNGCQTAITMNWNWAWTFKSVSINNCGVGIDMTPGNVTNQNVGSILVQDSVFQNTQVGVKTLKTLTSGPKTGGTLVLDNLKAVNVPLIVASNSSQPILKGSSSGSVVIESWGQGRQYVGGDTAGKDFQSPIQNTPKKPASLLDSNGKVFEKSRPQYETMPVSSFVSARSEGAKGDGKTDDTAALQRTIDNCARNGKVLFIDHGVYMLSDTLRIPPGTKITGECWPVLMSTGKNFADAKNPKAVVQVGQPGQKGVVEMSDLIFSTQGPAGGAIVMEWNMADPAGRPGSNGMWDVHIRIGGAANTKLQSDTCTKDPQGNGQPNPDCVSAFMLLHIGKTANLYMENNWIWTSDHELDLPDHNQISIYSGRGVWIESQKGPVWMYATASEHNVFYQYQITDASCVYMAMIQTETPYYQAKPAAPSPFTPDAKFKDPDFGDCPNVGGGQNNTCAKAWGLRIQNSENILVYGAGLYSFFENYDQTCTSTETCQQNMVSLEGDLPGFFMYNLNTKGSTNMITIDGKPSAAQKDNKNGFCETIAFFSKS